MDNNMIITKEEYAELVRKETKFDMIFKIINNGNIKYNSDIVDYIKFVLNIEEKDEDGDNNG